MDRQSSMQYLEVVVSECCGICLVMSGKGIKMHFFMEEYGGLVIAVLAVIVMTGILFGLFSQGGYLYEMISRAQGHWGKTNENIMERIWTDSNYCISGGNVTDIMLMGISHNWKWDGTSGSRGRCWK